MKNRISTGLCAKKTFAHILSLCDKRGGAGSAPKFVPLKVAKLSKCFKYNFFLFFSQLKPNFSFFIMLK